MSLPGHQHFVVRGDTLTTCHQCTSIATQAVTEGSTAHIHCIVIHTSQHAWEHSY